jgi:hypothetical protein
MSKNPLNKKDLKKIIKTTQNIEGYKEPSKEIIQEAKSIREKYGIKVSTKK